MGDQAFDVEVHEVVAGCGIESQFLEIQDAVFRMTLVAGHTDLFAVDIPMKKVQALLQVSVIQIFLMKVEFPGFGGVPGVHQGFLFSLHVRKN